MSAAMRRNLLSSIFFIAAICALAATAITWIAASSPATALNYATPTPARFFALVNLAKPTYTVTPTPTPVPTQTPAPIAKADVIENTPAPRNANEIIPPNYAGSKYILVSISEQHMYVYEGDVLVYSFVASTGMNNATRVGSFSVLDKIPNAYGETWNIWMPNWLGIYWAGSLQNGIHALPILPDGSQLWEGYLGYPISYGCVVLGAYEAQLLFDWAEVGTPVDIQR